MLKIQIDIEGGPISATLDDNPTSRDFVSLLPLALMLNDYGTVEKIGDLPKRLSTARAPAGMSASAGDVAYYAPWGNLAIFIKDFEHAAGLVKLGHIEFGLDRLKVAGPLQATISLVC